MTTLPLRPAWLLAASSAHKLDSDPPEVMNPATWLPPSTEPIAEITSRSISRAPAPVSHVSPLLNRTYAATIWDQTSSPQGRLEEDTRCGPSSNRFRS